MKNKVFVILFLMLSFFAKAEETSKTSNFKLLNLAREMKNQFFHQAPGLSIFSNEENSQIGHGLGIRFSNRIYKNIGFDWGVNANFIRNSSLINVDPTFTFGLNSRSYLLTGFNYNLPSSDWVFQFGAGFRIKQQWTLEAISRQGRQQYAGLGLRATYYFN